MKKVSESGDRLIEIMKGIPWKSGESQDGSTTVGQNGVGWQRKNA